MKKYLGVIALGMGLATAAVTTSWAQATGGAGGAGGPGASNAGAMDHDTGKVGSGNQPGAPHATSGSAGANEIQSTAPTDTGH
jgi:hypothetical protein